MRLRPLLHVIFGVLIGSVCSSGLLHAQPSGPEIRALTTPPGCTHADVDTLWAQRQAALAHGRRADARAALHEVVLCKQRAGWPDFFSQGEALAFESHTASASGLGAEAVWLAQTAIDLAPHRMAPHFALACALWHQGNLRGAIGALWSVCTLGFGEAPFRLARLCAYGLWLLFALSWAFVGLTGACLYRYSVPLWHDVRHRLPRRLAPVAQWALMSTVVLMPALMRLGPLTWALLWLAVLAPYLRRRERLAGVAGMIVLVLLVALLPWVSRAVIYPGSSAEAAYLATRDLGADNEAARLAAHLKPTSLDCYTLGLRARWQGNLADSRRWLERALRGHVSQAGAYISLGNARWLQQAPNEAMVAYKKAIAHEPKNVYALFNLSQVRLALVTEPQDDVRRRANAIDYHLVARLAAQVKKTGILVVEPPVPRELLHQPLHLNNDYWMAVAQLYRPLGGPLPRQVHVFGLLLLCIYMLWLNQPQVMRRRTTDCRRCGDAVCSRCQKGVVGRSYCSICAKIAGPSAQADRQARVQKEIASHRFFARRLATQRRLSWVIPGAGQLLKGEADLGLLIATSFGVCLLAILTAYGKLIELAPFYAGVGGTFGLLHALGAAVIYSVALFYGHKEEE